VGDCRRSSTWNIFRRTVWPRTVFKRRPWASGLALATSLLPEAYKRTGSDRLILNSFRPIVKRKRDRHVAVSASSTGVLRLSRDLVEIDADTRATAQYFKVLTSAVPGRTMASQAVSSWRSTCDHGKFATSANVTGSLQQLGQNPSAGHDHCAYLRSAHSG